MLKLVLWLSIFAFLIPLLLKENRFWSKVAGINQDQNIVIGSYAFLALVCTVAFLTLGQSNHQPTTAVFCALLASLAIIDARTQYIPNIYSLSLAVIGLGMNVIGINSFTHPIESAIAACAAYFLMSGANSLYKKYKRSHIDGLGMGDAKLLAALSCWFGFNGILPALLIANTFFIFVWFYRSCNNKKTEPMAMGPYLALAGCIIMLGESNKLLGNMLNLF